MLLTRFALPTAVRDEPGPVVGVRIDVVLPDGHVCEIRPGLDQFFLPARDLGVCPHFEPVRERLLDFVGRHGERQHLAVEEEIEFGLENVAHVLYHSSGSLPAAQIALSETGCRPLASESTPNRLIRDTANSQGVTLPVLPPGKKRMSMNAPHSRKSKAAPKGSFSGS